MMVKRLTCLFCLVIFMLTAAAALAQSETPPALQPGPTLNSILARGEIACGVNQDLRGFGYLDPNTGELRGFDVDFCRALSAAIFGDPTAVQLIPFSGSNGMEALTAGEIDVLLRNVTWTLTQDAQPQLHFGPVTFYTGQTLMVPVDGKLRAWADLDSIAICVVENSIAQETLGRVLASQGLAFQPVVLPTAEEAMTAFVEGQCQAYSANLVDLEVARQLAQDPDAYVVWQGSENLYTQEPFAPVYRSDDPQWADIVNWTILGTIAAEQFGVSSENVSSLLRQPEDADDNAYITRVGPDIARLLDTRLGSGAKLGLPNNFMAAVIREVGNYGEIYNRHFGAEGDVVIERGLNSLWRDGGLIYAPSWR